MITICPQCQLPLAVTAADLRIAQGQVRCGRCAAVFSALASLYEPPATAAERRGGATGGAASVDTDPEAGADRGASGLPPATDAVSSAPPASLPDSTDAFEAQWHDAERSPDVAAAAPAATADATAEAARVEAAASTSAVRGEPSTDAFHLDRDADAPAPRDRDWEIDTMSAAELAALVARADRDEPAELASIQIAIDDASEITVMPSESPRILAAAPPGAVPPDGVPTRSPAAADDALARSLPRLDAVPADDPQIERARAAVARGRESSLRWLELEPAQPAPGSLAASLGAAAEADFGARTGIGIDRPALDDGIQGDVRGNRDGGGDADPDDLQALASQLRAEPMRGRRDLDFDLGPDPLHEPVRASFDAALDAPPEVPSPDPALEIAATGAPPRVAPAPRWMWVATVVLGLGLAAQLVHLYREDLVGVPVLQGPLTTLYAALGRPVAPRWEIGRYEVRQQGVVAEPVAAGTLTVRASIRNGADRAQPAPLLRVILQDRFGNRIATRDLTPREYGGAAAIAPPPMLAPGQRIDAEVSLLDPGGEVVGFELDVCLRRADSSVACANDAPAVLG